MPWVPLRGGTPKGQGARGALSQSCCLPCSALTFRLQEASTAGNVCQSAKHSGYYSFVEQQWCSLLLREECTPFFAAKISIYFLRSGHGIPQKKKKGEGAKSFPLAAANSMATLEIYDSQNALHSITLPSCACCCSRTLQARR